MRGWWEFWVWSMDDSPRFTLERVVTIVICSLIWLCVTYYKFCTYKQETSAQQPHLNLQVMRISRAQRAGALRCGEDDALIRKAEARQLFSWGRRLARSWPWDQNLSVGELPKTNCFCWRVYEVGEERSASACFQEDRAVRSWGSVLLGTVIREECTPELSSWAARMLEYLTTNPISFTEER